MLCHVCEEPAAGKCKSCGLAYCGGHGCDYCRTCAVAIMPTGPGSSAFRQTGFLQCVSKPRMKTVYVDDDGPPECYECGGLARKICQNCQNLYCLEHAGKGEWCASCAKTAQSSLRLGLLVLLAMGAAMVVLNLWHLLVRF